MSDKGDILKDVDTATEAVIAAILANAVITAPGTTAEDAIKRYSTVLQLLRSGRLGDWTNPTAK